MTFRLLAFDYDETVAMQGAIEPPTAEALAAARAAGWKLAVVTGRPHEDLLDRCPEIRLLDFVVDENGAVLYLPASGTVEDLVVPPDGRLAEELARRGIPFVTGRIVLLTHRPHGQAVAEIIHEQRLPLSIYCNRYAVMVVPQGVSKATGLAAGLKRLAVSPAETIVVGDDENDLAMLRVAGLRVAVANAIDAVKAEADIVLEKHNGEGLAAFIYERLLGAPESLTAARRKRHG